MAGKSGRRFSPEEKSSVIRRFRKSGMTQTAFAKKAGIRGSLLSQWLRLDREARRESKSPGVVSVRVTPQSGGPTAHSSLEVLLAGGIPVPKSKLGRAVDHALEQWPAMQRYVEVGESEIDNNWCEQAIRPVVLGRKNWMFLGSAKGGGERAEVFYSLLLSAKRLGVEPFEYLVDVLERLPSERHSRIEELTPRGWREQCPMAENASS